jgi:uncharacterized protein
MSPDQDDAARDNAVEEFYRAVNEGDDDRARRLVAEWATLAEDPGLLILAAQHGRTSVVSDLLAAGAPPHAPNELDATPLVAAAQGGHLGVAKLLIEAGAAGRDVADAEAKAREVIARERFYDAIGAGDTAGMKQLLAEWPTLISVGEPLYIAVELGRVEAVRTLLDAGASARVRDDRGVPVVAIAAELGHFEIVQMLLDAGAERDVGVYYDPPPWTPDQ